MIGTAFILPVSLLHVFWSYKVIRSKVWQDADYH